VWKCALQGNRTGCRRHLHGIDIVLDHHRNAEQRTGPLRGGHLIVGCGDLERLWVPRPYWVQLRTGDIKRIHPVQIPLHQLPARSGAGGQGSLDLWNGCLEGDRMSSLERCQAAIVKPMRPTARADFSANRHPIRMCFVHTFPPAGAELRWLRLVRQCISRCHVQGP
jgi:hypothetical protein